MAVYLVTYDLVKEESSAAYKPLFDAIKKADCVKVQKSVWLLDDAATQREIYDYLFPHIDKDDRLMVVTVPFKPNWNVGLKGTKDWINAHF
jgi:CRISPR/Cas system-associated endoribonuclease Cas2